VTYNKHCGKANEGKISYVSVMRHAHFREGEVGEEGRDEVVYAIDIAYRFRGRGKEGRVDPSSEQILFKYFLVRPKNIFVTRL